MADQKPWMDIVAENPGHSAWYIERFRSMAAAGDDLAGEARMIDAMAPRGARILDAGCGPGRVGAFLADAGHQVVGVDIDPALIAAAEEDHPGPTWIVGDLAEVDLVTHGIGDGFDVIVCAGNVLTFVAAADRRAVIANLGRHLADDGRLVFGFGAGRGYGFDEFRDHVADAHLELQVELASWDLRPCTADSGFLVAILGLAPRAAAGVPDV